MYSNTQSNILTTAIILFGRYGYDSVSMRQIAFDAGVKRDTLGQYYKSKEELLDSIVDYIGQYAEYYEPTPEIIKSQLKTLTPAQVLGKFITYYHWGANNNLQKYIYRLMYAEQYRSSKISYVGYHTFVRRPITIIRQTLDLLVEFGEIPPCDTRAIAEMWNRVATVYGIQACHDDNHVTHETYVSAIEFIIQLAVRGVRQVPLDSIDVRWDTRPIMEDIHIDRRSTKQRIMFGALDLFSAQGYGKASMRAIAGELGVSVSTIYRYYHSKSEIMQDIVDRILDGYSQFTADNPVFTAVMQERDPVQIALTLSSAYPPLKEGFVLQVYRILFREQFLSRELEGLFLSSIAKDCSTIADTLDRLAEKGRIKLCDSEHIAISYVYTMCSLTLGATAFHKNFDGLDSLRLRTVAILVSLILYGYLDEG